jgi:hypothetical protein
VDELQVNSKAVNDPDPTGGIRNFAWVQPGTLARGEQPVDWTGAYAALRELGVSRVLSLRETGEGAGDVVGRWLPVYRPDEEQAICRQAGMDFLHMPCRDGRAPDPEGLAAALAAIEASAGKGEAVFVHCMAGVGRTGIVAAAWLLAQGASGDEAARHFLEFMDGMRSGDAALGVDQSGFWQGSAIRAQWWILQQVAIALGSPVGSGFPWLSPGQPAYARGWDEGYARLLAPWRRG